MPWYFLYFLCFVALVGALYLYDSTNEESSTDILADQGILAVIIALSLAFGFFTLVCCLGYALVKIPWTLWRDSDLERKKKRLLLRIAVCEDRITDQ